GPHPPYDLHAEGSATQAGNRLRRARPGLRGRDRFRPVRAVPASSASGRMVADLVPPLAYRVAESGADGYTHVALGPHRQMQERSLCPFWNEKGFSDQRTRKLIDQLVHHRLVGAFWDLPLKALPEDSWRSLRGHQQTSLAGDNRFPIRLSIH